MDNSLPSYEAATARDHLPLIAAYVRRQDLRRASLVCRHWHGVFSQVLWASPERLWEMGDRNALRGFMLFLRSTIQLPPSSRPKTTNNTTRLNLSYISSSIYTTLPPTWFHLLLSNLPSLLYLNVSNINFLSLENLIYLSQQPPPMCTYTLRTFIATGCHNLTALGLEKFICIGWPQLEALDLSDSSGVAQLKPLGAIANNEFLPSVRKIALRNLELRDRGIEILAKGLGTRIMQLDIRGNLVSDVGIQWLLDYCFLPPEYEVGDRILWGELDYDIPPPLARDTRYGRNIVNGGITHLMVSHNPKINWSAVEKLLKTTRLESLDCGIIAEFNSLAIDFRKRIPLPILSMYAHKNLNTLRIDFRVISPMAFKAAPATISTNDSDLRLKPEMLPNLRKLVLCGVPYYTPLSFGVMDRLKLFLDDLADAEAVGEGGGSQEDRMLRYLRVLGLEMQDLTVTEDEKDRGIGMYASSSTPGRSNKGGEGWDSDDDEGTLEGDFSFFGDGEEGAGGWKSSTKKLKPKAKQQPSQNPKRETQLNVLNELEKFRQDGRKGLRKFWKGDIRVVRDLGWDDQGGMERGSSEVDKWGVIEDRV